MNSNARNIFRAVHEGKWLSIEYRNKVDGVTKYRIAVTDIDLRYKSLKVDGLHLGNHTVMKLSLYLDSIVSSTVLDGTYCPVNQSLIDDINVNPHKYKELFGKVPNLRILNYLSDCNRLDAAPHKYEHALIPKLDSDRFRGGDYRLDDEQYTSIIAYFQQGTKMDKKKLGNLALNVLSVHMKTGFYVLAYKRIDFDVSARRLCLADDINLCKEFTVNSEKQSVRKFLDAEDYDLLDDVEGNLETINGKSVGVVTPFANQQKTIKDALKNEGITSVTCGTVHAFQGDEKDTILFSTALTDNTHPKTYNWLKNNKEFINVATSRAKEQRKM